MKLQHTYNGEFRPTADQKIFKKLDF